MQAVDNKMDAGLSRAGSLVMLSMQLRFCTDAPSRVRSREALRQLTITDVGTAGHDNVYSLYIFFSIIYKFISIYKNYTLILIL